jgi:predicted permease
MDYSGVIKWSIIFIISVVFLFKVILKRDIEEKDSLGSVIYRTKTRLYFICLCFVFLLKLIVEIRKLF